MGKIPVANNLKTKWLGIEVIKNKGLYKNVQILVAGNLM